MGKTIPEHFQLDASILDSMAHLLGKTSQITYNLEVTPPEKLKLRLQQICISIEQTGAFIVLVEKWCGNLSPEIIDMIPTWVLLAAEANFRE